MGDIIRTFDQFNIINEAKKIEVKDDEIRKIYELLKDFHDNTDDGTVYKTRTKLMTLKNATKRIINVLIDTEIGLITKENGIFISKNNRVASPTKIKALLKEYKKRNRDEDDSKADFRTALVYGLLMKIYSKFKRKAFKPITHSEILKIVENYNKDNSNKVDVEKILYLFTTETPLSRDIEKVRTLQLMYRWSNKNEPTEEVAKKLYKASYEKETAFEKEMRKEDENILASKLYKMNKEIENASSRIKDLSSKSEESNKKREEEKYRKLLFGSNK
jgi:hypothetical protein